jgi:hypothetical protein
MWSLVRRCLTILPPRHIPQSCRSRSFRMTGPTGNQYSMKRIGSPCHHLIAKTSTSSFDPSSTTRSARIRFPMNKSRRKSSISSRPSKLKPLSRPAAMITVSLPLFFVPWLCEYCQSLKRLASDQSVPLSTSTVTLLSRGIQSGWLAGKWHNYTGSSHSSQSTCYRVTSKRIREASLLRIRSLCKTLRSRN